MASRSLLGSFGFDVRRSVRPAVVATAVALALFILIGGGAVGAIYMLAERSRPQSPLSDAIPLNQLTSGMLQGFECVRVGPKACDQYDQAITYLESATPTSGLVYTPYAESDPGQPSKGGTRTVALNDALSATEWKAIAAAVTRNGQATEATVPPAAVQLENVDTATYVVPGTDEAPAANGTMVFALADGRVELRSVTYD